MKRLRGVVSKVRFSTEVFGGGESFIGSNQIATFQIEGKPVELKLPSGIIIEDGDEVVVAGSEKNGVLKAHAYKNIANGATGKNYIGINISFGILFAIVGVFASAVFGLVGIVFVLIGIYTLYKGIEYSKAYSLVLNT